MSAASARAALIDLASSWRAQGMLATRFGHTLGAQVYATCAARLDETTITHLSTSVRDDQWASTQLGRAVEAFTLAMGAEGIPVTQIERVVNRVEYGHPDGYVGGPGQ